MSDKADQESVIHWAEANARMAGSGAEPSSYARMHVAHRCFI